MYYIIVDVVYGISCFQLAVFSFFLIHKGRRNISNLILAAFFIVQFIVILNFLLLNVFEKYPGFYIQIAYSYYPFEYLWGPLIYFYVKSKVKQGFRFKTIDLIHIVPFVLIALFIISHYYIMDNGTKYQIANNGLLYNKMIYFDYPYFFLLFSYNLFALLLISRFQRNLQNYCSFVVKQNLVWLKFVLYGYIITCIVTAITTFSRHIFTIPNDIVMLILFIPFLVFFTILFYKALIHPYIIIMPGERSKYSGSSLNDTDIQQYSKSIETFLTTKKLYLNPTLTLRDLSEATGIAERNISQVINSHWNQNFFSFVNSYRIEEAKTLLKTVDMNKTTMESISYDAGFNSKSAFYETFKKLTGMTPKEYRKMKV